MRGLDVRQEIESREIVVPRQFQNNRLRTIVALQNLFNPIVQSVRTHKQFQVMDLVIIRSAPWRVHIQNIGVPIKNTSRVTFVYGDIFCPENIYIVLKRCHIVALPFNALHLFEMKTEQKRVATHTCRRVRNRLFPQIRYHSV